MTGISGTEFVLWALPIWFIALGIGIYFLHRNADRIEAWGRKHIHKK